MDADGSVDTLNETLTEKQSKKLGYTDQSEGRGARGILGDRLAEVEM